jgi:hypothetical protein
MQSCKNKALALMVVTFFMLGAVTAPALAQDLYSETSGASMAVDFVLLRPLGIAATAVGCVFFIATLPFTVWSKKRIKQAGYNFVVEPGAYSFVRPLGDLQDVPLRM